MSCPRWDLNPRHCFPRPVLCPLSYQGSSVVVGRIRQYVHVQYPLPKSSSNGTCMHTHIHTVRPGEGCTLFTYTCTCTCTSPVTMLGRDLDTGEQGRECVAHCTGMRYNIHVHVHMNDQSLRLGKAKQLRLKTTPFFLREKEELPQAGLKPATFCIPGRCSTN